MLGKKRRTYERITPRAGPFWVLPGFEWKGNPECNVAFRSAKERRFAER